MTKKGKSYSFLKIVIVVIVVIVVIALLYWFIKCKAFPLIKVAYIAADDTILKFWTTIITATVTIIGVVITIYVSTVNVKNTIKAQQLMKDDEIKANLVSKARIQWIQEARNIVLEYMSLCEQLGILDDHGTGTNDNHVKILRDLVYKLNITYLKFKLFLGEDSEGNANGEFLEKMKKALEIASYNITCEDQPKVDIKKTDKMHLYLYGKEAPKSFNPYQNSFIKKLYEKCTGEIADHARAYFKKEWLRVSVRDKDK